MSARILERIDSPRDLKALSFEQLEKLAAEIRQEIVSVVSVQGGHLGASLGAVELTLAIHSVFDAPEDLIVWDVGHQAYGHKLLTGRRQRFHTLRQEGGLSGFPVRSESPFDTFGVAHASTALGAALGMAVARDLRKESRRIVAVVGDGGMTGGVAYEAINNIGHLGTDLLVVLNDNEMSISKNVGALSKYLTRVTTSRVYSKFEAELWELLGKMPQGDKARLLASRMKEGMKNLVAPGMLFEELGLRYFGPFDGHDLRVLVDALQHVKKLKGPVLLHAVTVKGKGYAFAEEKQEVFHGLGSFDKVTGAIKPAQPGPPPWTRVFGEAMVELGAREPRLVAITAAMPSGTGTKLFGEKYPERFFDVGIAEQAAVLLACGLATQGMKPVAAIYSTFLQRAYDQVIHDTALQKLPVVFVLDRAGLVGDDGPTHNGVFDIAYLRSIPNLVLMAPADADELRHMLYTALHHDLGPVALRFPRGNAPGAPTAGRFELLPLGKAQVLRAGEDVALVGYGTSVDWCVRAAALLEADGVLPTVVNARFAKPLDAEVLCRLVQQHRLVLVAEEHQLQGGFGTAVLELCEEHGLSPAPVRRLGIPDRFIEHAPRERQLELLGLTPAAIAARVRAELGVPASRPGVAGTRRP
ncbi:MAG TPA: 1-deoxy-D-xylulose-5-phosphate synthase [Candidatus Krumholzibacteria bacterium]|nr:1-deoxy-D-xylulose-5-phosphate synthase [Candidatus Krumholzibacteria bacterium]